METACHFLPAIILGTFFNLYSLGALVACILLVYLIYAMVNPDKF